jgi:hypothetical protein
MHPSHISLELSEVNHRAYNDSPLLFIPLWPYQHFEVKWHMLIQLTQNMVQYQIGVGDSQGLVQSIKLYGDGTRGKKLCVIIFKKKLVCRGDNFYNFMQELLNELD